MTRNETIVGVIGQGAIGAPVALLLSQGAVSGAVLDCVVDIHKPMTQFARQVDIDEAIARCDLLVECSGPGVVKDHGERILDAGVDLLICSVGALADEGLAERLRTPRAGRLFVTPGAIGGLEMLSAASSVGAFTEVVITTTKLPEPLVQPWMSEEESTRIRSTTTETEVFSGSAREAARRFPRSLNVAASVALAVGDWNSVRVTLNADPCAVLTSHVIEATGPAGSYRFECRNHPSEDNPRTSGVVPFAVLRSLENIVGRTGGMI